jgi:hypothetical protein
MRCDRPVILFRPLPVPLLGEGRGWLGDQPSTAEGEGQPLTPNLLLPLTLDQFGFRQTNLCPLPMQVQNMERGRKGAIS